MITSKEIRQAFRSEFRVAESIAAQTTFGVGGAVDYLVTPSSIDELCDTVKFLRSKELPFVFIGRRSNLLVSDDGFRGVAINLEKNCSSIRVEREIVEADPGIRISTFVDACVSNGLAGSEALVGMQGSLGGALILHRGFLKHEVGQHIVEVEIFRDQERMRFKGDEVWKINFAPTHSDIILGMRFRFSAGSKEELFRRRHDFLLRRNAVEPVNFPQAGMVFRNSEEVDVLSMLRKSGLAGKVRGKAMISKEHPNFILNLGDARTEDIYSLIRMMQKELKKRFHTSPDLAVRLVGFAKRNKAEAA